MNTVLNPDNVWDNKFANARVRPTGIWAMQLRLEGSPTIAPGWFAVYDQSSVAYNGGMQRYNLQIVKVSHVRGRTLYLSQPLGVRLVDDPRIAWVPVTELAPPVEPCAPHWESFRSGFTIAGGEIMGAGTDLLRFDACCDGLITRTYLEPIGSSSGPGMRALLAQWTHRLTVDGLVVRGGKHPVMISGCSSFLFSNCHATDETDSWIVKSLGSFDGSFTGCSGHSFEIGDGDYQGVNEQISLVDCKARVVIKVVGENRQIKITNCAAPQLLILCRDARRYSQVVLENCTFDYDGEDDTISIVSMDGKPAMCDVVMKDCTIWQRNTTPGRAAVRGILSSKARLEILDGTINGMSPLAAARAGLIDTKFVEAAP